MTRSDKIPISVVVPVKNEEANLPRCLARLHRFDEVIVVDSSSTDRTREIVLQYGFKLVNFEWDGRYPKKRNWILLNHKLACEWVLFLDADEYISDSFCEEANRAVRSDQYSGFWLNYTNWFLGRRLRYGVPQRKLALFRVGRGLYERIDERAWSALDMEIHEHPIIDGLVGEIAARIDHNDDRGIAKFIDRHRDYALWEARRVEVLRKGPASAWTHLTPRQKLKYHNLHRWWFPWFFSLYGYVIRFGFLDGAAGFHYACYRAWYLQSIQLLIKEQSAKEAREAASS